MDQIIIRGQPLEIVENYNTRSEDNIREWIGLEFAKSQRTVENRKMEKTGCSIICGAPAFLAVKG